MNALVKIEPIPLPNLRRPALIPSLPAWLAHLTAAARPELQLVGTRYRDVMVVPKIPNVEQKQAMTDHIASLFALLRQTPASSTEAETKTATAITKILLVLPSVRKTEIGAEVTSEVYLDVLDDVPYWAVESAIRLWHRHECGTDEKGRPHDYKWAPDPGTVRQVALRECQAMENRIKEIEKVLSAREYVDCTADLERGRAAMAGLWDTYGKGAEALKNLTFDKAVEIGRGTKETKCPAP